MGNHTQVFFPLTPPDKTCCWLLLLPPSWPFARLPPSTITPTLSTPPPPTPPCTPIRDIPSTRPPTPPPAASSPFPTCRACPGQWTPAAPTPCRAPLSSSRTW